MLLRELFEQESKTAVLAFGRLNPPTVGHAKLVEKIVSIPGDHFLFLSHTQKPKTDPLDFLTKLKFAQQFFPNITVGHPSVKTPVLALEYLQGQGYTDVIFVAGSDRVEGFQKLFDTYNGQPDKTGKIPFKFNSIRVVSAGERDPDADDVSGMSASKMRAAAAAGELETFAQGVPDQRLAKTMFDAVRKGMGVNEDTDLKEFDVRSNKKYSKTDTYKGYEIYVSVNPVIQGQHMAVAYDRAGKEAFRGKGRVPEQAANMIKDTIDGRQKTASKVQGNATIDFNAQFSREILEPSMDKIYAKIVAGPKLIIANSEYYNDTDALLQMGFKPTAFRTKGGLLAMGMTAKQTQGAELVANGRYYVGDKSYDEYENAVYDLDFHSVVNDKNEKYSLGKPGLTVGTTRKTEGVEENFTESKYGAPFTFKIKRRKLNVPALIKAGAIFITYPHGEQGWETDDNRVWSYSLISLYNVHGGGWAKDAKNYLKPQSYKRAEQQINSSAPNLGSNQLVYDGKYNQILWSIKKLNIPNNVAFLDNGQQDVAENFADGKEIGIHRGSHNFNDIDLSKSADGTFWLNGINNTNWDSTVTSGKGVDIAFEISPQAKLATWDDIDKYSVDELENMGYDGVRMVDGNDVAYQIWNTNILTKVQLEENFADGKKPGRKGLAKRSGVNTKASVSSLRKTAKNSSGEKQRMAHWLANMKAGRAKKK